MNSEPFLNKSEKEDLTAAIYAAKELLELQLKGLDSWGEDVHQLPGIDQVPEVVFKNHYNHEIGKDESRWVKAYLPTGVIFEIAKDLPGENDCKAVKMEFVPWHQIISISEKSDEWEKAVKKNSTPES